MDGNPIFHHESGIFNVSVILPIASAIQDYYCVVKSQIGKLYKWIKADQVQNAQLPFYNSAVWFLLIGSLSERKKFNACYGILTVTDVKLQ